jgi:hypothetical protein
MARSDIAAADRAISVASFWFSSHPNTAQDYATFKEFRFPTSPRAQPAGRQLIQMPILGDSRCHCPFIGAPRVPSLLYNRRPAICVVNAMTAALQSCGTGTRFLIFGL